MKKKKSHILIVEDDVVVREELAEHLSARYRVDTAATTEDAMTLFRRLRVDLVLLDLHLPDGDGLSLIGPFRADDEAEVIVITAFPKVQTAIAALKAGAHDYINKPFDIDELDIVVDRALAHRGLRTEIEHLKRQSPTTIGVDRILGKSAAIERLRDRVRTVAASPDTTVLIRGESGVGKELVAEALHGESARRDAQLVRLSCSSIPAVTLETELFGYERGAFTGSEGPRRGLIEVADRGTLFLDEVGDLPPDVQPKLLRVLEGAGVRRVGGTREFVPNIRFVAATNCNLEQMVADGTFRRELLFRIKVFELFIPPLRDHREDLPILAQHFIDELAGHVGKPVRKITSDALQTLSRYEWPGNVRELRNVIERALILARGDTIDANDLPTLSAEPSLSQLAPIDPSAPRDDELLALAELLADVERRHIVRVYRMVGRNKSRAADLLRISRTTLREKLRLYNET